MIPACHYGGNNLGALSELRSDPKTRRTRALRFFLMRYERALASDIFKWRFLVPLAKSRRWKKKSRLETRNFLRCVRLASRLRIIKGRKKERWPGRKQEAEWLCKIRKGWKNKRRVSEQYAQCVSSRTCASLPGKMSLDSLSNVAR